MSHLHPLANDSASPRRSYGDELAQVVASWHELPDHVRDLIHRLAGGDSRAPESRSSDRTRSDELRGERGGDS